jgi:uncharacterized membrane-anchored protein
VSRNVLRVALVLPLLVIVLAIARAELFLRQASEFTLPIGGYDPRDLLQGHYLQFRLVLDAEHTEEREACDASKEACCWCLSHTHDTTAARAERATCHSARELCEGALTLKAADRNFRFYIPEAQATILEQELRDARAADNAYATFALDQNGEARVRELTLAGKRYTSLPGTDSR